MIVLSPRGRNTYDDNSWTSAAPKSWKFQVHPTLSLPNTTKALHSNHAKVALMSRSTHHTKASLCSLCRRANCQLRSHRAYLSAEQPKSKILFQDLGIQHPGGAKPKSVDDRLIRAAFTKSYAFSEPSYLSVLQPSSFRVDVFHDLPILGGDRPEMHALIRDFLSHHFQMLYSQYIPDVQRIDILKQACLAVALTSHTVCLYMIATENAVREQTSQVKAGVSRLDCMRHYRSDFDSTNQQLIDPITFRTVSESIISMCIRLIMDLQARQQTMSPTSSETTASTDWTTASLKRLDFGDTMA